MNQVMFICYEGVFKAEDGPAKGVTCEDVGVREDGDTDFIQSLQLENRQLGGEDSYSYLRTMYIRTTYQQLHPLLVGH